VRNIQAILFDFDGVILESVDVKGWAFTKLYEAYPEYVDKIVEFHHAHAGVSRYDKIRYIQRNILKMPLAKDEFVGLCAEFSKLVCQRILECDFVPGAPEFLEKYHQRIPLFIVSATPQEEIRQIVKAKGLNSYFRGVYGSPKPKDYWVNRIVEEQELNHKEVFFVGDAMSDFRAARKNELFFIARVRDIENDAFRDKKLSLKIRDLFELDAYIMNAIPSANIRPFSRRKKLRK
jgi:HAD superfamily hydrolase (TIGR01549 family)